MRGSERGSVERRLEELEKENRWLREQLDRALKENARLKQENERLRRQLEEALRATHRQAAPFSRGQPKPAPKPPGRKAGQEYGQHHCRAPPRRVDERIAVPLPPRCPGCGGGGGFAEAALLLGAEYSGWVVHDGLRCYYGFQQAFHQSCLAHPLRRCRDLLEVVSPSAARFPLQVRSLLQQALALRDRYQQAVISLHGLWTDAGRLESRLDRLLARPYRSASNRRLAAHLRHEQPHLLTFLCCPGLEATNNAAERALRRVVIARKVWGGNRTWKGARTHEILASVLASCQQQGQDAFARIVGLLRSPVAKVLDMLPNGRSP